LCKKRIQRRKVFASFQHFDGDGNGDGNNSFGSKFVDMLEQSQYDLRGGVGGGSTRASEKLIFHPSTLRSFAFVRRRRRRSIDIIKKHKSFVIFMLLAMPPTQ